MILTYLNLVWSRKFKSVRIIPIGSVVMAQCSFLEWANLLPTHTLSYFDIFLKYSWLGKTVTVATSLGGFWPFFRLQFEKKIVLKANLKECMCMLYSVHSIVSRNGVSQYRRILILELTFIYSMFDHPHNISLLLVDICDYFRYRFRMKFCLKAMWTCIQTSRECLTIINEPHKKA